MCSLVIFSHGVAHAFPVAELPDDNLIVNPWFRNAGDRTESGFDGWTLLLTDGHTWGLSQKESNPSPDLVVAGKCGSQQVYCGTAARWAEQDGVLYPNIDVFAYQVVAADPSQRKLKFFAHFVSHRVEVGAVNVYGGESPDGPWQSIWSPLYHTQDVQIVPENGGQQELWVETGFRETIAEQGFPYYKVELQSRLPELAGDMIRGAGFKITGIYFATEFTDEPGGPPPTPAPSGATQSSNDEDDPTPAQSATADSAAASTPEATPEVTPDATPGAEPAGAQPPTLSAEALSTTEVTLTVGDAPSQARRLRLERSLNGTSGWRPVASLTPGEVEHVDTGLSPDSLYYYRVRASKDLISNVVSVQTLPLPEQPLAAPGALSISAATPDQMELNWADLSEDESGFVIERSLDGTTFTTIETVGPNVTTYVDGGLEPATYYYRVQSYRVEAFSDYSEIVSATIEEVVPEVEVEATGEPVANQTNSTDDATTSTESAAPGRLNLVALVAALIAVFLAGVGLTMLWVRRRENKTAAPGSEQMTD